MIPHVADRYNQSDDAMDLLGKVSPDGLKANARAFHDAAIAVQDLELNTSLGIVEAFLRADMPNAADELVTVLLATTGDTVRMRRRRTLIAWPQLALRFERAISARDTNAISEASRAWSEAVAVEKKDKEDERERRARSDLPF
jgi:hypothetical protein